MTDQYLVTGLMSGSSLDGVDLACCRFSYEHLRWQYRILAAETFPYPTSVRQQLENAIGWGDDRLMQLDLDMGNYFGEALNRFHRKYGLTPDLIASHGHTILHEPSRSITLQVGNGAVMAEKTGIRVVNDFRKADVQQGGQGAPLVPVGDRLLFSDYGACMNLGGFANLSYETDQGFRIAYDIGPCNLVLNWGASLLGKPYDPEGSIARSGQIKEQLFNTLNGLPYYSIQPPKSLGREWFLTQFLPHLVQARGEPGDLLATAVEHLALQMGAALNQSGAANVLVTGGGSFNHFLLERLEYHTGASLMVPDQLLIAFKEALIFALLGLLRTRGEINCLASVTGGKQDLSAGEIHTPK
jgi:anhydro-N-acetylmuramic acid kinase